MEFAREYLDYMFEEIGKKRFMRIIFCTLVIALIWCFADWISGSLQPNYWHDVICLVFGIIAEAILPWGKKKKSKY